MDTLPLWLSILKEVSSLVLAAGTLVVLFLSLKTARRSQEVLKTSLNLSKELKSADVLLDCSRRYDLRVEERQELIKEFGTPSKDADDDPIFQYYEKFWLLQWDQYSFYKKGYVDDHIFKKWLDERHDEYNRNKSVGKIKYKDGWMFVKNNCLKDNDFIAFMEEVFKGHAEEEIRKIRK